MKGERSTVVLFKTQSVCTINNIIKVGEGGWGGKKSLWMATELFEWRVSYVTFQHTQYYWY